MDKFWYGSKPQRFAARISARFTINILVKGLKAIRALLQAMNLADKLSKKVLGLNASKRVIESLFITSQVAGVCNDCRRGYMISCTSEHRAAYGWQRDGGMAPYLIADEKDLVYLPDELSYIDGAQVACGFGTVYEGLEKVGISGNDAVLVVGLGPVGLAALMLARAMGANKLIGVDVVQERLDLVTELGLADHVLTVSATNAEEIKGLTDGYGVERAIDASGNDKGRLTAIQATRKWGKVVFIGEGGHSGLSAEP